MYVRSEYAVRDIPVFFEYQRPMLMVPFSPYLPRCSNGVWVVSHLDDDHEEVEFHGSVLDGDILRFFDVDTGESAISIALGSVATGTGETAVCWRMKYSERNMGWKQHPKNLYLVDYNAVKE
ncbi:hypothetical protein Tco_0439686 [Tanacetum coccineum]